MWISPLTRRHLLSPSWPPLPFHVSVQGIVLWRLISQSLSSGFVPFPQWLSAPLLPLVPASEPSLRAVLPSCESDVHVAIVLLCSRPQISSTRQVSDLIGSSFPRLL